MWSSSARCLSVATICFACLACQASLASRSALGQVAASVNTAAQASATTDATTADQPRVQQQSLGDSAISVELRERATPERTSIFTLRGLKDIERLQKLNDEQLQALFTIRVARSEDSPAPPLLGNYTVTSDELQFVTRYPLSSAVKYSVEVAPTLTATKSAPVTFALDNKPLAPAPTVAAVYPTADVLPENLLKFYIHFSSPMSRGEAYEHIHLMHDGTEIKDPFLELGEELWDVDQTRFTLFIHPGRIKRGVKPREDDGLPMTDGKEYSLQIDQAWQGADRQPLATTHIKKFRVVAADEGQPNPVNWKIGTPKAGSQEPVTLTFNESLDHAMLNRVFLIRNAAGELLEGRTDISEHETVWSFVPAKPWKRADYAIEVATNLEDLCGNSIARPFETKMQLDSADTTAPAAMIAIEFAVE